MIILPEGLKNTFTSPTRKITAMVELFEGSTKVATFAHSNKLKSFTVDRVGEENKFFGFGVCQRLNLHLIDSNRELNITTANSFKVHFLAPLYDWFPTFQVTEVHRDENTNELSITAYDIIYKASAHAVEEANLETPYNIAEFTQGCAAVLGLEGFEVAESLESAFFASVIYPEGANFSGSESIRDALNRVAEATQTIYYINSADQLVFMRLDIAGEPVLTIGKADYITLESGDNRRLSAITHATELGDNVTASSAFTGTTQYVRNNPFWEMREDVATLVENALAAVSGTTINQFTCSWRGNPALEVGDKIALITKDDETIISYVLDDVFTYDGSLSEKTQWKYADDTGESASNPSTLGEILNQTFARVDKVNKEIEMVASETSSNSADISTLKLSTENIAASVESVETMLNDTNGSIETLTARVEATVTAEDLKIQVQNEIANGTTKVVTSTGFTFDDSGLTVSKSDSEVSTQITENGMTVKSNNGGDMLIANNEGVQAKNLHAHGFLIIGTNSRFEDYDGNRTGCFWIGG